MPHVLILDDHDVVLQGAYHILETQDDCYIVESGLHENRAAQQWPRRSAKPFVFRSAVIRPYVFRPCVGSWTSRLSND
jgi:hypothetical protein